MKSVPFTVTTTPQAVPVASGTLTVGMNITNGQPGDTTSKGATVFYGTDSSIKPDRDSSGAAQTPTGVPIPVGKEKYIPPDHFNASPAGSIYVVVSAGTQVIYCESQ